VKLRLKAASTGTLLLKLSLVKACAEHLLTQIAGNSKLNPGLKNTGLVSHSGSGSQGRLNLHINSPLPKLNEILNKLIFTVSRK
jgi:hypothetical protein